MSNIISLAEHQATLCERADAIIGEAIRLKSRLKNAVSEPLPEQETDDLIRALAVFVAAADRCPR